MIVELSQWLQNQTQMPGCKHHLILTQQVCFRVHFYWDFPTSNIHIPELDGKKRNQHKNRNQSEAIRTCVQISHHLNMFKPDIRKRKGKKRPQQCGDLSTHLVNSNAILLISCTKRYRRNHSACLLVWIRSDMDRTSAKAVHMLLLIDRVTVYEGYRGRHFQRDGG